MYNARLINVALGLWLVLSLAVWPHEPAQATNHLVVGGLIVGSAFLGVALPAARFLNVALGAWLVASTFILSTMRHDTLINSLLVGTGVFVVALLPNQAPAFLRKTAYPRDHFRSITQS